MWKFPSFHLAFSGAHLKGFLQGMQQGFENESTTDFLIHWPVCKTRFKFRVYGFLVVMHVAQLHQSYHATYTSELGHERSTILDYQLIPHKFASVH